MSYCIRRASPADNRAILELVARTPQDGLLRLNFERDPDFFAGAAISSEQPEVWVAEQAAAPGAVVAVINIGSREVYVNGEVRRVRYGNDLRIDPAHRGGLLLHRLFRRLRAELAPGEWMQTVILDGNDVSLSTVGSGRAGMPGYYPAGVIESSLLSTGGRRRLRACRGWRLCRATAGDLPAMQALLDRESPRRQFHPCHRLEGLLAEDRYYQGLRPENFLLAFREGELTGMLGDWDQQGFKRTRVLAYPGGLRWLRHGYNAMSALAGGMSLPAAGECFHYRVLHTPCVAGDDPAVLRSLLEQALIDHRDCDALVCGFFESDPLARALGGLRRRRMRSLHFLVSYDGDPRPGLDPARLPFVEIARL